MGEFTGNFLLRQRLVVEEMGCWVKFEPSSLIFNFLSEAV